MGGGYQIQKCPGIRPDKKSILIVRSAITPRRAQGSLGWQGSNLGWHLPTIFSLAPEISFMACSLCFPISFYLTSAKFHCCKRHPKCPRKQHSGSLWVSVEGSAGGISTPLIRWSGKPPTVVGKGSRNTLSPLDTDLWGPRNPPIRAGKSSVSWSELAHPLSSPVLIAVTVLDVSLLY